MKNNVKKEDGTKQDKLLKQEGDGGRIEIDVLLSVDNAKLKKLKGNFLKSNVNLKDLSVRSAKLKRNLGLKESENSKKEEEKQQKKLLFLGSVYEKEELNAKKQEEKKKLVKLQRNEIGKEK